MKEKFELSQSLDTLVLTAVTYYHHKVDGDEVNIDGNFFDIKHISFHDDKVTLLGLWDEKESILIKQLSTLINGSHNHKILKIFAFLFNPCLLASPFYCLFQICHDNYDKTHFYYNEKYQILLLITFFKPPIY